MCWVLDNMDAGACLLEVVPNREAKMHLTSMLINYRLAQGRRNRVMCVSSDEVELKMQYEWCELESSKQAAFCANRFDSSLLKDESTRVIFLSYGVCTEAVLRDRETWTVILDEPIKGMAEKCALMNYVFSGGDYQLVKVLTQSELQERAVAELRKLRMNPRFCAYAAPKKSCQVSDATGSRWQSWEVLEQPAAERVEKYIQDMFRCVIVACTLFFHSRRYNDNWDGPRHCQFEYVRMFDPCLDMLASIEADSDDTSDEPDFHISFHEHSMNEYLKYLKLSSSYFSPLMSRLSQLQKLCKSDRFVQSVSHLLNMLSALECASIFEIPEKPLFELSRSMLESVKLFYPNQRSGSVLQNPYMFVTDHVKSQLQKNSFQQSKFSKLCQILSHSEIQLLICVLSHRTAQHLSQCLRIHSRRTTDHQAPQFLVVPFASDGQDNPICVLLEFLRFKGIQQPEYEIYQTNEGLFTCICKFRNENGVERTFEATCNSKKKAKTAAAQSAVDYLSSISPSNASIS
ncbi:uncharacterized protein LOC126320769 [Schistocerca gregaria]|uniref:uncharacterized protein LOC126320769 n=1 Tax=Schistocerca gregaria TaxID=7010 RepID=UPI00211E4830|nr:uncharacterized protein LOC126320769 [Schistocerca gregaria]